MKNSIIKKTLVICSLVLAIIYSPYLMFAQKPIKTEMFIPQYEIIDTSLYAVFDTLIASHNNYYKSYHDSIYYACTFNDFYQGDLYMIYLEIGGSQNLVFADTKKGEEIYRGGFIYKDFLFMITYNKPIPRQFFRKTNKSLQYYYYLDKNYKEPFIEISSVSSFLCYYLINQIIWCDYYFVE